MVQSKKGYTGINPGGCEKDMQEMRYVKALNDCKRLDIDYSTHKCMCSLIGAPTVCVCDMTTAKNCYYYLK